MNVKEQIASLNLPINSYVVVGSGILGALKIRQSNDIDLVVDKEVCNTFKTLGWSEGLWGDHVVYQKGLFDIGSDWYGENVQDLLKRAQLIDDVPYLSLDEVYEWKKTKGRPKDMDDLALIDAYISSKNQQTVENIHGSIVHDSGRKDSLIRVSLKAVILDDKGRTLVVKERDRDWWDIPGGGLDHGESIKEALARELFEEVSLEGDFDYEVLLVEDPRYLETLNLYQMRITFLVKPTNMEFKIGDDGDEIRFVDAGKYETSDIWTERQIFMFSMLAKKK